MIDAVNLHPVAQQVAYEVAVAPAALGAQGRAFGGPGPRTSSQGAGARIHCVVSAASAGDMAVCDNATLISLGHTSARSMSSRSAVPQARPAVLDATSPTTLDVVNDAGDATPTSPDAMGEPTRRWFADLLMTFGIGMLLVSCFLFMTSRDPLPVRRRA